MKEIAKVRMVEAAARYGEHAPVATACCNACRTCVQSNLIGLAFGVALAAVRRVLRRHASS